MKENVAHNRYKRSGFRDNQTEGNVVTTIETYKGRFIRQNKVNKISEALYEVRLKYNITFGTPNENDVTLIRTPEVRRKRDLEKNNEGMRNLKESKNILTENKRSKRSERKFFMDDIAAIDDQAKEFYENLTKDEAFLNRMRMEFQEALKNDSSSRKQKEKVAEMVLKRRKNDDVLNMDDIIDKVEDKEERVLLKKPINEFRPEMFQSRKQQEEALRQMLEGQAPQRKRRYLMTSEERNRIQAWNVYCNLTGDQKFMDGLREAWKKNTSSQIKTHILSKREIPKANDILSAVGNKNHPEYLMVKSFIPIIRQLDRVRRFLQTSAERDKCHMFNQFANLTADKSVLQDIKKEFRQPINIFSKESLSSEHDEGHYASKNNNTGTKSKPTIGKKNSIKRNHTVKKRLKRHLRVVEEHENTFAVENQGNILMQNRFVQSLLPILRRVKRYYGHYVGHEKGPKYYKIRKWILSKFLNDTGRPQNYSFGGELSSEVLTYSSTLKIVTKKIKIKKMPNTTMDRLDVYKKKLLAPLLQSSSVKSSGKPSITPTNSSSPGRRRRRNAGTLPQHLRAQYETDPPKSTSKWHSTTLNLTVEAAIKRAKKEARKFGLMLEKWGNREKKGELEDEHFAKSAHEPFYFQKTSTQPITVFSWEATETGEEGRSLASLFPSLIIVVALSTSVVQHGRAVNFKSRGLWFES